MTTGNADFIDRIFAKMIGIYGSQFSAKFSQIVGGRDVGLALAKAAWAEELAGFRDSPEAIVYALKSLPQDFPPNALQFADLCRKAPRAGMKMLTHELPPVNHEKSREFAAKLQEILRSGSKGSDPIFWATHPKSHLAFEYIRGAAKNDPLRFQPCIDHLISEGKVSEDGKRLLKKYIGLGEWGKA